MVCVSERTQFRGLAPNALPLLLVGGMGGLDFVWNVFAHLHFTPPFLSFAAPAYICFAFFTICRILWPNEIALELSLYLGLWTLFPIFGSQLSYLAATIDFPLKDQMFMRADAELGFNWLYWFKLVWSYPQIENVLFYVYESYLVQPIALVCIFAFGRVPGRNRELLVATMISVLLVIAISATFPAYGPPRQFGIPTGWDVPYGALRHGTPMSFSYVGIVTFPSLHACVAILFTLAARGNFLRFATAAVLNAVMLVSTAPLGGHYLVDLIAGCLAAVISFSFTKLALRAPWCVPQ